MRDGGAMVAVRCRKPSKTPTASTWLTTPETSVRRRSASASAAASVPGGSGDAAAGPVELRRGDGVAGHWARPSLLKDVGDRSKALRRQLTGPVHPLDDDVVDACELLSAKARTLGPVISL